MINAGAALHSTVLLLLVIIVTMTAALAARYVRNRELRLCVGSGLVVIAAVFSEISVILTVLIAALGGAIIAFGLKTERPDKTTTVGKIPENQISS
ncbi:MAG: hypothetical protein HZA88_09975 [Verrucomicrobia bacterium]|nr:hypothetical protein [Verrucomicrobiota bacterium]